LKGYILYYLYSLNEYCVLLRTEKITSDGTTKSEDIELALPGPELAGRTEGLPNKVTPVREWDRGKRFGNWS